MISLTKILKSIEEEYNVIVKMGAHSDCLVNQVLFWETHLANNDPNTLYLTHYREDFTVELPGVVLFVDVPQNAEIKQHLYIMSPIKLFSLFNTVQNVIHKQLAVNIKKEELFEVLKIGYGIKSLIKIAFSYLQNPINICDASFSVIARMPDDEDTSDIEEKDGRIYVKDTSLASMRGEKLIDRLFNERTPFFANRPDFEYEWLYCSIHINQAVVGYICVRGKNRQFTEEDIDFTAAFAGVLSIEMQKSEFFVEKTGLRYEYFLSDLLNGGYDSEAIARKRLKHLGRDLDRFLWIFTFFYDDNQTAHLSSSYSLEQIHAIFPTGIVMVYMGHPIVLISRNNDQLFKPFQLQRLTEFLQLNSMDCAVSYCFTNILETKYFYEQTLAYEKLNMFRKGQIAYYEEYAIEHLLKAAKSEISISSLVHHKIRLLLEYDRQHNTDFSKTLRCYLEAGRNAVKAARELNIHKSTLFYRIGKISEVLDISLGDTKRLFLFDLSFKILDIL